MLKLTVTKTRLITDRIRVVSMTSPDGADLPSWTPGAHVDVSTGAGPRSYSLIKWPEPIGLPNTYQIAVQLEPEGTGGSAAVHQLAAGDLVEVGPPANDFELVQTDRPVLLLAGGIGITPLISMATALNDAKHPFALHYAGRSKDLMAYISALTDVFHDHFHAHFDDQTPLDLPALMHAHADHAVYICGPKGMIDAAREAAEAAGILAEHIHVELFTNAVPEAGDSSFEVEISDTGQVITVPADQTIIEALEDAGVDLVYDCQRGDCGICQTDVISGTPDHRDVVLSQAERDSGKVMQICVSRAKSARLVLDL